MNGLAQGRLLRDTALSLFETTRKAWLEEARAEAIRHASTHGQVTNNDVRQKVQLPEGVHPNAWGAVLKCKELKAVGFDQAHHPAAHARVVRIYKLKEIVATNL